MSVTAAPPAVRTYAALRRDLDAALQHADGRAVDGVARELAARVAEATRSQDVSAMHEGLGDLSRLRRRATATDSELGRDVAARLGTLADVLDHASTVALVRRDQRELRKTTVAERILALLAERGPMTASELVAVLDVDKSYVSKVVGTLRDERGLITEVPAPAGRADARAKWLAAA